MKNRIYTTIPALLCLIPMWSSGGEGSVFQDREEAPKPSKTPKSIYLQTPRDSAKPFTVRGSLAEIRLDNSSSRGGAGMTGRLNTFRKFIRLDVRGVTPLEQPAKVEVKYSVKEGTSIREIIDTINFTKHSANFKVDTEGFEDVEGTEVKTSSSIFTTTSRKYKHFSGEIISVIVTFTDKEGKPIYIASWPEAPTQKIDLPERLRPRVFTSSDGRKMTAVVAEVRDDSVILDFNGKQIGLPLSRFSAEDQEYLRRIGKLQLTAPADTLKPTATPAKPTVAAELKPTPSIKLNGNEIDLLAPIPSSLKDRDGAVDVTGIAIPIRYPTSTIPQSYQVSFEIKRISGTGAFLLGVTNGQEPVILRIDHWIEGQTRRCHGIGNGFLRCTEDGDKNPPPPAIPAGTSIQGTFDVTPDRVTLSILPDYRFSRPMNRMKPGMPNPPAPFFIGSEADSEFSVKYLKIKS